LILSTRAPGRPDGAAWESSEVARSADGGRAQFGRRRPRPNTNFPEWFAKIRPAGSEKLQLYFFLKDAMIVRQTSELRLNSHRSNMKKGYLPLAGIFASPASLLGFAWLLAIPVHAQNLLKNGDFEQAPLGPTNWSIIYLHGGPDDFDIKDRTRGASAHAGTFYGGNFRPVGQKLAHACFTQTVTNLTPGHVYHVSGQMKEGWWSDPIDHTFRDKFLVYIEAIGGQGTPTEDGRASLIATNALDPDANIDPPYTYPTDIWREFTTEQTPDANRKIEIRLHFNMVGYVEWDKCWLMNGYFDDLVLTP
jgi:hypothetical protein